MTDKPDPESGPAEPSGGREAPPREGASLRRMGRNAWALLGVVGVLVVAGLLASRLTLVLIPLVLALFPATLLEPVARRIRGWKVPRSVAALVTLATALVLFGGLLAGTAGLIVSGASEVVESAGEGLERLEELVGQVVPGASFGGVEDLLEMMEGEGGEGDLAGHAIRVTTGIFEVMAALVLLVVILFFYLHSGRSMTEGIIKLLPADRRARVREGAETAWGTLGRFFRGQIVVALADGIFIGIGLLVLGVPLAVPLAVLTFFGGLFPIVGALVTGAVAILVALAHGGLTLALLVTGLVILVQQLESNVLAPLVLGRAIDLHPLSVILSVTAGGLLLGVLGAFLAVPTVAVLKAVWLGKGEEATSSSSG